MGAGHGLCYLVTLEHQREGDMGDIFWEETYIDPEIVDEPAVAIIAGVDADAEADILPGQRTQAQVAGVVAVAVIDKG